MITAILLILNGCGASPKLPEPKRVVGEVNQQLNKQEADTIFWLSVNEREKNNNCIMTTWTYDNGKSRLAYCYQQKGSQIALNETRIGYPMEFTWYYTLPEVEEQIKSDMNKLDDFSQEYLKIKTKIQEKISTLNPKKPNFVIETKNISSDQIKKHIQSSLLNRFKTLEYYRNYSSGRILGSTYFQCVSPLDPFRNEDVPKFLAIKYSNPVYLYYDYKIAQKKNKNLSLDEFFNNNLVYYSLSTIENYEDEILKFRYSLDKKYQKKSFFYYLDAKDLEQPINLSIYDVEADYMPKQFQINNQDIKINFFKRNYQNIEISNSSNSFIDVKTISIYYDDKIVTQSIDLKMPPNSIQKVSVNLDKLGKKYLQVKGDNQKILTGLAVEYFHSSENKQKSLHKTYEYSLIDLI